MKRILWMVLMNLWYVPYGIIRLFRMAAHPERYSLEERYALIRQIDNRAIKGGRVVIQGDGMDRLPKDDGFILYPNHQGMFDEKGAAEHSVFEAGVRMPWGLCA